MRITRARLVLPARMKGSAIGDARQIAETIAQALSGHGSAPSQLSIRIEGAGRPARHLGHDLVNATNRALGARPRKD